MIPIKCEAAARILGSAALLKPLAGMSKAWEEMIGMLLQRAETHAAFVGRHAARKRPQGKTGAERFDDLPEAEKIGLFLMLRDLPLIVFLLQILAKQTLAFGRVFRSEAKADTGPSEDPFYRGSSSTSDAAKTAYGLADSKAWIAAKGAIAGEAEEAGEHIRSAAQLARTDLDLLNPDSTEVFMHGISSPVSIYMRHLRTRED